MDQFLHYLSKADRLEQSHDLIVEVHCTRQVVDCRLALQHESGDPLQSKKIGEHRSNWTTADDRDLGFVHLFSTRCDVGRHGVSSVCCASWLPLRRTSHFLRILSKANL